MTNPDEPLAIHVQVCHDDVVTTPRIHWLVTILCWLLSRMPGIESVSIFPSSIDFENDDDDDINFFERAFTIDHLHSCLELDPPGHYDR